MDRTILLAWSRPPLEEEAVLTGMLFGAAATSAGGVAGLSEVPARRWMGGDAPTRTYAPSS